jgi:hypothetical protein
LGSGKKAVVLLVGIQKYRELFGVGQGCVMGCVPSNFKQFRRILVCGGAILHFEPVFWLIFFVDDAQGSFWSNFGR